MFWTYIHFFYDGCKCNFDLILYDLLAKRKYNRNNNNNQIYRTFLTTKIAIFIYVFLNINL